MIIGVKFELLEMIFIVDDEYINSIINVLTLSIYTFIFRHHLILDCYALR